MEVEEQKFIPKGGEDILAKAINKPGHPGRVRGVPLYGYIKQLFDKEPKKWISNYDRKMKVMANMLLNLNAGEKLSQEEVDMVTIMVKELDETIVDERIVDKDGEEPEKDGDEEEEKETDGDEEDEDGDEGDPPDIGDKDERQPNIGDLNCVPAL